MLEQNDPFANAETPAPVRRGFDCQFFTLRCTPGQQADRA